LRWFCDKELWHRFRFLLLRNTWPKGLTGSKATRAPAGQENGERRPKWLVKSGFQVRQVSVTIWMFVYRGLFGQPKGFDLYVCKVSFADIFVPWQGILAEDFALIDL